MSIEPFPGTDPQERRSVSLGPRPAPFLSMNDRLHWAARNARTQLWRQCAWAYLTRARAKEWTTGRAWYVTLLIPRGETRVKDPSNLMPTLKAVVDGGTDAGLWPDDDETWVTTVEPVFLPGTGHVYLTCAPRP